MYLFELSVHMHTCTTSTYPAHIETMYTPAHRNHIPNILCAISFCGITCTPACTI